MARPTTSRRASVGQTQAPAKQERPQLQGIAFMHKSRGGRGMSPFYGEPTNEMAALLNKAYDIPEGEQWRLFIEDNEWLIAVNQPLERGGKLQRAVKLYLAQVDVSDDAITGTPVEGMADAGDTLQCRWWTYTNKQGEEREYLSLFLAPAGWTPGGEREVLDIGSIR